MEKLKIFNKILEILHQELEILIKAAHEAHEAATDTELIAENKYDTKGLEQSYLAGGQAKRASELRAIIKKLETMQLKEFSIKDKISYGALVEVRIDGDEVKHFFVLPDKGGIEIKEQGLSIFSISPESPIGKLIFNKTVGEYFDFRDKEYEIIGLS